MQYNTVKNMMNYGQFIYYIVLDSFIYYNIIIVKTITVKIVLLLEL